MAFTTGSSLQTATVTAQVVSLGVAAETDAVPVSFVLEVTWGAGSPVATGTSVATGSSVNLSTAAETDVAPAVGISSSTFFSLGAASETDAAPSLIKIGDLTPSLGAASETDAAPGLSVFSASRLPVSPATEANSASSLSIEANRTYNLSPATENDAGRSIFVSQLSEESFYWLRNPDDSSMDMRVQSVTAHTFEYQVEEAELLLIGRGRKVDRAGSYSTTGSLTFLFRDVVGGVSATQQREKFSALHRATNDLYLSNPFGDVTKVKLTGDVSYTRQPGMGPSEYTTASVSYSEVL